MEPTIQTFSGHSFNLLAPELHTISIKDIAHALSNICRYTGHTGRFYSVAEHSVMVADMLPPNLALHGLLHDASEAYIGDVSSPLKHLLPDYQRIERTIEAAIARRFMLKDPMPPEVKHADLVALATERRDLMPHVTGLNWASLNGIAPSPRLSAFGDSPVEAERRFLLAYEKFTKFTARTA